MKVNKDYFCEHCGKRIPYSTNKQGLTNHKYNISKNTVKSKVLTTTITSNH